MNVLRKVALRFRTLLGAASGANARHREAEQNFSNLKNEIAALKPKFDQVVTLLGAQLSAVDSHIHQQHPAIQHGFADVIRQIGAQVSVLDTRLVELMHRRVPTMENDLLWIRGFLAAYMTPRPEGDLRLSEKRYRSQNGEDGIIEEIFRRIGTTTKYFVEFGVEDGLECNCAHLALTQNWGGLFLECDPVDFPNLVRRFEDCKQVRCVFSMVSPDNIESLFEQNGVPTEPDLLSIDVDGNDYWIWKAVNRYRPRLVIMEYNPVHGPEKLWVMKENPDFRWGGDTYYGASLGSLTKLGREKGYTLVGTCSTGVNAFFVRNDLIRPGMFIDAELCYHYSPGTHGPKFPGGHPKGDGPFVSI